MSPAPDLAARLLAAGQGHLTGHLGALAPEARARLAAQLAAFDLELMARVARGEELAPPPPERVEAAAAMEAPAREADAEGRARGVEELRRGRVAFAIVAGGQGTRLRHAGPKGAFPIGPRSDRSLFQVLVEKVLRAARDHRATPPLAVTTSEGSDAAIRDFFGSRERFGFPEEALSFARQASLPALDDAGRFLLAAPDRVASSPDGHGGAIAALRGTGVLAGWRARGVRFVATVQVDNPLLRVVDEQMIGRLALSEAPVATKVIRRREPGERVGVLVVAGGRPSIVEYSEIRPDEAARRRRDGGLVHSLGSIAAHVFRIEFLEAELERGLPLHLARKEIPCTGADGKVERRWGRKLERFLFDLFPRAPSVVALEATREREYAPLKNADGPDSPDVVRAALDREYRRWHREAGVDAPEGVPLELSPLDADGPEDLVGS